MINAFTFMANAFYILCGTVCIAVAAVVVVATVNTVTNIIRKGKNNEK